MASRRRQSMPERGERSPAVDAEPGLVEACQRGQVEAFERLFQLHGARMRSIALNLLGNSADAEDAVQEAFLKIYRGVGYFKGQSAFSTWIYRILMNACYDMRRRSLRRPPEVSPKADQEEARPDPPAPAADHPLRMSLQRSLRRLGEKYRAVFVLYEIEGFSHAEIGRLLRISQGASKNRLFEAKRELRRMLTQSAEAARSNEP